MKQAGLRIQESVSIVSICSIAHHVNLVTSKNIEGAKINDRKRIKLQSSLCEYYSPRNANK